MELKNQVVNLELSRKMKELGFEQESAFYWRNAGQVGWQLENEVWMRNKKEAAYSAYTVAELGEMLPRDTEYQASHKEKSGFDGFRRMNLTIGRTVIDKGWYVMYSDPHPANKVPVFAHFADTEADARAKMLIYLKEQKLI